MFSNESNNGNASNDTTTFNPFEALFGRVSSSSSNSSVEGNETGLGFYNNGSFGNDPLSSFMVPDLQNNETVDILRMLELLQGGGN